MAYSTNYSFEFLHGFHSRCLSTSSIPGCKKVKMTIKSNHKMGSCGQLKASFVRFGHRALIFCLKALGKYENDTTFVSMRSGEHPGDAKVSKKGTYFRRI